MNKQRKFRILLTLRTNILLGAGTEKVALYYARYLPKDKWEVFILSTDILDYQRLESFDLEKVGVKKFYQIHSVENKFNFIKNVPYFGPNIFEFLQYTIAYLNRLTNKKTLKKIGKYDLAYHMYFLTPLITKGCSATNIISEHTIAARKKDTFISTLIYCFHFLFMHNNNFLHALSNKSLGTYYAGLPVVTVSNGYDSEIFYPREILKPETVNFAFLARLEPGKGLRTVLESWKTARKNGLVSSVLHVVGTGSLSNVVKDFKDPSVIYHGGLTEKELVSLLGTCDFFIYPSIADTFALVVLEALGSGCHVLTTTYLKGIFDRENALGYLEYLERKPDIFASRILDLAASVDKYRDYRFAQAVKIKEVYEWKNVVSRLSDFFLKVTIAEASN